MMTTDTVTPTPTSALMDTVSSSAKHAQVPYRYEFAPHQIHAVQQCLDDHGFAVVKNMITPSYAEELRQEIRRVLNPNNSIGPGESALDGAFIERAPVTWKLLENREYVKLMSHLNGTDDLTIFRTAAIIRAPGGNGVAWHSDMSFRPDPPRNANDVLNRHEWLNGMWFYLTGSLPDNGGLAVIADSHRADWSGPEGFTLDYENNTFYPTGGEKCMYPGMDVPGMVALYTQPEDLILFAARTYHAAFAHRGSELRLSGGIGLRPRAVKMSVPWALPESAQAFMAALPPHLRKFTEGYTGIKLDWQPAKIEAIEERSSGSP